MPKVIANPEPPGNGGVNRNNIEKKYVGCIGVYSQERNESIDEVI
jgi:hypothetical protein